MTPLNRDTPPFEGPRRNWYQRRMHLPAYLKTGERPGRPSWIRRQFWQALKDNPALTLKEALALGYKRRTYYALKKQYVAAIMRRGWVVPTPLLRLAQKCKNPSTL